jgi:phosphoribosylamine--glycine ligase
MENDFMELLLFMGCEKPEWIPEISIVDQASVAVCISSKSYPQKGESEKTVTLGKMPSDVTPYWGTIEKRQGQVFAKDGRIACLQASGKDMEEARIRIKNAITSISFEGMAYRTDIGMDLC